MTESAKARGRLARLARTLLSRSMILVFIIAALIVGYWLGAEPDRGGAEPTQADEAAHDHDTSDEEVVWSCAMHPQIRKSGPGQCPICGMDLVPVDNQAAEGMRGLRQFVTSPEAAALMGIQAVPVVRDFADAEIRMVGKVDYDETQLSYITAWVPGRIDELFVDFTGIRVNKGDHMVSLYSPQLITAQEELWRTAKAYASLRDSSSAVLKNTTESTMKAAREKLRRWGLSEEQINAAQDRGVVSDHVTVYAPAGGTVIHRSGQEGMYVDVGTRIYTLADLDHMWVKLDAYESDLPWLKYGQRVEFTTESYAGKVFEGRVTFIDPFLDPKTRTAKVRINVSNEEGLLKPEMFVSAVARPHIAMGGRVMDPEMVGKWVSPMHPEIVKDGPGNCDVCGMQLVPAEKLGYIAPDTTTHEKPLLIPVSAALVTGRRAIVYVEVPDSDQPTFEGREIVLGPRAGDKYIVMSGLAEGERVVEYGNFKIDSALQIMAKPSMMTPEGGGGGGHDHGGMAMAATPEEKSPSEITLDYRTKEQLQAIWRGHAAVEAALERRNEEVLGAALEELNSAINAVDMSLLAEHPHMVWMEYSRRLQNDAMEASLVTDERDRNKAFASLKGNLNKLGEQLDLHFDHEHDTMTLDVPEEVQSVLSDLMDGYLAMQVALAADDSAGTQTAARRMATLLPQVEPSKVAPDAATEWSVAWEAATRAVGAITKNPGIETMRLEFRSVSQALDQINRLVGVYVDEPLYTAHCPMAFDGDGASWIQSTDEVRNPYYGSSMLTCGSITEKLMPVSAAHSHGDGSDHNSH